MTKRKQPQDDYKELKKVLNEAVDRASKGKGLERHGSLGLPFEQQPIVRELKELKSDAPALYQIRKKAMEARRLDANSASLELLDIINYAAAAIIWYRGGDS